MVAHQTKFLLQTSGFGQMHQTLSQEWDGTLRGYPELPQDSANVGSQHWKCWNRSLIKWLVFLVAQSTATSGFDEELDSCEATCIAYQPSNVGWQLYEG